MFNLNNGEEEDKAVNFYSYRQPTSPNGSNVAKSREVNAHLTGVASGPRFKTMNHLLSTISNCTFDII